MQIKKGTTDVTLYFHLRDSADGTSKTGLVFDSGGAVASYVRTRDTRTAITLATLAAADSAHSNGGFKEVDGTNAKGLYRLDVADAAFASGVDEVIIHIGFTGVFEESLAIELVDERPGNLAASQEVQLNAQGKLDVNAEADSALSDIHLDHLLAVDTGAALPGVAGSVWHDLLEDDGGTWRYSANALEQGPSASDVWDELLTGATHNIATSAGRRLREAVDVMVIHDGTCQAGGGNDEAIFDVGASAVNDFYLNDLIILTGGTGAGQQRHVDSYVGSTKTATINRDWSTNPDATTTFSIKADSSKHVHGFETAAKAEIESEANDALVALKLDHLIAVADSDDPVNDSIIAKMAASDGDWSGFDKAIESLEAIRDRGDSAWIGESVAAIADAVWDELQSGHVSAGSFGKYLDTEISGVAAAIGSGLLICTWTQNDGSGNPMDNVQIWITTDEAGSNVVAGALYTNTAGEVVFHLDAGTYYVWREKGGYNFTNPQTWTVS